MKLGQLRDYALSLPATTEAPHFDHVSFRVKGKIFVSVPPEGMHAHVFVDDAQRDMAVGLHPGYVETLMWGRKAAGVRISLAKARPDVVFALVRNAWERKAPKTLLKTAG